MIRSNKNGWACVFLLFKYSCTGWTALRSSFKFCRDSIIGGCYGLCIESSSIPSQEDVRVGVEFGIRRGALHLNFPSPFHSPLSLYTTHTSILSHFRRLQLLVRPLSPTRTPWTAAPSTSSWSSLLVRSSQVLGCCCQLRSSPHGISLANRLCVLIIGGGSSSRTCCSPRQHVCNQVSWCGLIDHKKESTHWLVFSL